MPEGGLDVRVVLTPSAAQFVTPLTAAALSGDKVYSELFDLTDETEMGHIMLSRQADLVVVAPATANLMAKAANGLADDLASTLLLATDKPVLMAPAMNVRMWHHPATQRNLATLKSDGVLFVGPEEGDMACGEYGLGRMSEPEAILAAIQAALPGPKPLIGKTIVITAGPTFEALDPVRGLTNRSSGKQGLRHRRNPGAAGGGGDAGLGAGGLAHARRCPSRRCRKRRTDAGGRALPGYRAMPLSAWRPWPTGGPSWRPRKSRRRGRTPKFH